MLFGFMVLVVATSRSAMAASCWVVTGWTSTDYVGAAAIVSPADCTTVPTTHGWTPITEHNGTPPTDDLWLRISLTDSRVTAGVLKPLLFFSHYDGATRATPVVVTDMLPCTWCANETPLLHTPPLQGVPVAGSLVRLRHLNSGNCITTPGGNGTKSQSGTCSNLPSYTFVLDAAGAGLYRLRNQSTNQCLYSLSSNGSFLWHWGCWASSGMRFSLDTASGGYRLRHYDFAKCAYDQVDGVHTWGCWADPAMVYRVDVIQY